MPKISAGHRIDKSQISNIPIYKRDLVKALDLDEETYHTAVDNLIRVRLADFFVDEESIETEVEGSTDSHVVSLHYGYKAIYLTSLGLSFVEICAPLLSKKTKMN